MISSGFARGQYLAYTIVTKQGECKVDEYVLYRPGSPDKNFGATIFSVLPYNIPHP